MTIERKVGMGIAGQPSGGPTDVADVFSTHLYTGNSTARSINNGIDLDGKGGMVWIKSRSTGTWHKISDTERGANKLLFTNEADGQSTVANTTTGFNSDGFSLGAGGSGNANDVNVNNRTYTAWTFRKKEKFFDVVTYTGNGTSGREIAHSLDTDIGMIVIKRTDSTGSWVVGHRGSGSYWASATLRLNTTSQGVSNGEFNALTASYFKVTNAVDVNANGATYVAYVFADNSSEDAEDQMIKCGSYTGNGSTNGPVINLGWEPQFIIIKSATSSVEWQLFDSMRGVVTGGTDKVLHPNTTDAEYAQDVLEFNSTGFQPKNNQSNANANGQTYIYMAIRAPMMVEPEAATDVFGITTRNVANDSKAPEFRSTFPVDMALKKWNTSDPTQIVSRLTQGKYLTTNSSNTEQVSSTAQFYYNNGWSSTATGANTDLTSWMWKRAKGFFDVVAYTGTGSNLTLPHSLGVAPEMMWIKNRSNTGSSWLTYVKDARAAGLSYGWLDLTSLFSVSSWPLVADPTSTVFYARGGEAANGASGNKYIVYLFASLAGISKVGNYTGNGSSQTISCGFSSGARFILIKRTDANGGSWYVWDSVRGIVAGNDPHFSLHTNNGDITNDDSVDPHNSGFIVNQLSATNINVSSAAYIFYAIA